MDPLSRLIRAVSWILIAWLLMAASVTAFAQTCTVYKVTTQKYDGTYPIGQGPDKLSACSALVGQLSGTQTVGVTRYDYERQNPGVSANGVNCTYDGRTNTTGTTGGPTSFGTWTQYAVAFTTLTNQQCDVCASRAGQPLGQRGQEFVYPGGSGASPTYRNAVCDLRNNCLVAGGSSAIQAAEQRQDGTWQVRTAGDMWTNTGSSCTTQENAAPESCPKGQYSGTVNGASVCIKATQTTGTTTGTTTGPATGSGTTTTTTNSVCNAAGACTTTITTTISGATSGNGTTTETRSESRDALCARTPASPICSGSGSGSGTGSGSGSGSGSGDGEGEDDASSFGGSCGSFSCDGDAVQCSIALEQHKRACEFQASFGDGNATALTGIGTDAAAAGLTPSGHPRAVGQVATSALTFDQTDIVGGGCPSDMSVAMPGGRSVAIPFSQLCAPAAVLGNILVGLTALTCIGIVFVRGK